MKIDLVDGLLKTSIITFDAVTLGDFQIKDFKLDVGTLHEKLEINGLLGLDLLVAANVVLDLSELTMYSAKGHS